MKRIATWITGVAGAALLASCSTSPTPTRVAAPGPAPVVQELPYRWTQGNAPQAHKDAVALFGPLYLRPGDYRWTADIPQTGDTKVVIDT